MNSYNNQCKTKSTIPQRPYKTLDLMVATCNALGSYYWCCVDIRFIGTNTCQTQRQESTYEDRKGNGRIKTSNSLKLNMLKVYWTPDLSYPRVPISSLIEFWFPFVQFKETRACIFFIIIWLWFGSVRISWKKCGPPRKNYPVNHFTVKKIN